jgi:Tol biopolymer transport system component
MPLTSEGSLVGTLPYMAPEQVEGKEADARSDIFALGVMLYELISGNRPFAGASQASLIASILKEQPRPLQELQPLTSSGLDRVIQTCLEKDPDKRWQSAREVKHALEWVAQDAPGAARSAEAPAKRLRLWQALAALMTLIALGLAGWMFRPQAAPLAHRITFQVPVPEGPTSFDFVSLSPDGRKLVATGTESPDILWLRDLETLEWRRLPGTEGGYSPFWSPDGRFLAFAAGNQIKKIDISGGPPQTLCTVPIVAAGYGAWNREGVIVFGSRNYGSGGPLWKISPAGGTPAAITAVDHSRGELFHSQPDFLPDGRHFLYFQSGTPEVEGVYAGSLDSGPGEQPRERILAGRFAASYANGYLFFLRENTLMAQPFDAGRLQLRGEPVPMAGGVGTTWYNVGIFSASPSGALAYRSGTGSGSLQLTWLDRQGKTLGTFGQPSADGGLSLSPDGTRGLVIDNPKGPGDLWMLDFARGLRTRLTFGARTHLWFGPPAVWSPDGSRIAYAAGSLSDAIYEKASSGAGEEKELFREPNRAHFPTSWSRDGRFLLYVAVDTPKTGDDLWVLPVQGDRKPVLLLGSVYNEWAAAFSPDMRWIAYNSNETEKAEVYVRPFLAEGPSGTPSLGEGKWQISKDGGRFPKWRADGKEIFFEDTPLGTGKMAVEVKTSGATFEYGAPHRLFQDPGQSINFWDAAPDGKRFLVGTVRAQQSGQVPITVVLNWEPSLKK